MPLGVLQFLNIANRPQFSLVYACNNHRIDIKMSVQNSSGTTYMITTITTFPWSVLSSSIAFDQLAREKSKAFDLLYRRLLMAKPSPQKETF